MADGSLQHDFLIRSTRCTMHVCNAPSSALPIADYVLELAQKQFEWSRPQHSTRYHRGSEALLS